MSQACPSRIDDMVTPARQDQVRLVKSADDGSHQGRQSSIKLAAFITNGERYNKIVARCLVGNDREKSTADDDASA